jgi:hypothetical protein
MVVMLSEPMTGCAELPPAPVEVPELAPAPAVELVVELELLQAATAAHRLETAIMRQGIESMIGKAVLLVGTWRGRATRGKLNTSAEPARFGAPYAGAMGARIPARFHPPRPLYPPGCPPLPPR